MTKDVMFIKVRCDPCVNKAFRMAALESDMSVQAAMDTALKLFIQKVKDDKDEKHN